MADGNYNYNYLDDYRRDAFAEAKGLTPIVFDQNRICEVTPMEEIKGWTESPMGKKAQSMGMKVHKYRVECPNPNHGAFSMLLPDIPKPWSYHCYHCISEEMRRIDSLRLARDLEYMRQMRGMR